MAYNWLLSGIHDGELSARQKPLYAAGYAFLLLYAVSSCVSVGVSSIAMGGGALAIAFFLIINKGRANFTDQQAFISKTFFLFCACIVLTSLFSYDPKASISGSLGMAARFMPMFMAMFFLRSKKQVEWLVVALLISVLIADLAAINQLHKDKQTWGFINNRIYFANQLLLSLIIAVACFFNRQHSLCARSLVALVAVTTAGVLIFSHVRGVWLATLAVYVVFLLLYKKHDKKLVIFSGIIGLSTILCFWLNPGLLARIKSIGDYSNASNIDRIYMWQSAWKMFTESPLYGFGFQQFGHFYTTEYHYLMPSAAPGFAHAHNVFMTFLAETGLIGIIAFLTFFTAVLFITFKNYLQADYTLSLVAFLATAGFLFGGLTDNVFAMPTVMRLVALIIGIGISRAVCE